MRSIKELAGIVSKEIENCLGSVSDEAFQKGLREIEAADQIFVAGAGRSGLAIRGLAMRLMHAGKKVHVVGDVTTPKITEKDLLIIGSGSGSTEALQCYAKKCKNIGARLLLLTIVPESPIGALADSIIRIPAPSSKARNAVGTTDSLQAMGSLFEQSLFILGDCLILEYMEQHRLNGEEMFHAHHANLE